MKTMHNPKPSFASSEAHASAAARYQIYQQSRSGVFTSRFKSDSAGEVVEAFLKQAPAYEGGELRIWNHHAVEQSASVEWRIERTDFGFPVHHRTNVFYDPMLGLIARRLNEREAIRSEVHQSLRMSA